MKKIITLLLALTIVCTFLPVMASASATVSYGFSTLTWNEYDEEDIWEKYGAFALAIKANGAKYSGGSVGIAYDTTKVYPCRLKSSGPATITDISKAENGDMTTCIGALSDVVFWDSDKGYIVLNLTKSATLDWSEVTGNNDVITTLLFAPIEDSGVTPENIDGIFSAIPADDQYLVDCQVKVNGGAGVFADQYDTYYSTDANTLDMNFFAVSERDSETGAVVTLRFPTENGGTGISAPAKKTVKFGKNETSDVLKGATEVNGVVTGDYSFPYGDEVYYGALDVPVGANWAIVLVDVDGTIITE